MLTLKLPPFTVNIRTITNKGYRVKQTFAGLDNNADGTGVLFGTNHITRYDFFITTALREPDFIQLDLMMSEHEKKRIADTAPLITLEDTNLPIYETTPSRPSVGAATPVVVPNGVKYFPVFEVAVTSYKVTPLAKEYLVELEMRESLDPA